MRQLIFFSSFLIFLFPSFIKSQTTEVSKGINMKLLTLTPNLMVEDVNATAEYYKVHFGFEVIMKIPEEGAYDWAMIQKDEVSLMLQSTKSLADEYDLFAGKGIGGSLTFFITMNNIEELFNKVNESVKVIKGLEVTFYGMKEFTIEDMNGYIVTFAERVVE